MLTVGEIVRAGGVLLGGPQITKLMAGTDEAAVAAVVTGAMSGTALVELLAALRRLGIWDAEVLECERRRSHTDRWYLRLGSGEWLPMDQAMPWRFGSSCRVIVLKGE